MRQRLVSVGILMVFAGTTQTVPGPVKRLWLAPFINYSRSLDRAVLESKTYGGLSVAVR